MRALVLYCHPSPRSFTAAIRNVVLERLAAAGAEVTLIDLYAEGFPPILTRAEWEGYERTPENAEPVLSHAEALRAVDTLIFVYPTWWCGLPALLKGWLDRVLLPGVAFTMPREGRDITPGLTHVSRLAVFTTCGASWWLTTLVGAPGRRTILRGVRALCHPRVRTAFCAHYSMDSSTPQSRARHLVRVAATLDRFLGPRPAIRESPARA
ncbi:MAG TPA: NAD(P)H-dependent oxidoreductase [Paracoccaceae bacterium]|nr:NAD(P)H-dependent oxidoreductase [Paracoccaceae bacterium]